MMGWTECKYCGVSNYNTVCSSWSCIVCTVYLLNKEIKAKDNCGIYLLYVDPNSGVYTLKTQILPVIIHHQQKLFQTNSIKVFSSEERLRLLLVGANCKNGKWKRKQPCFKWSPEVGILAANDQGSVIFGWIPSSFKPVLSSVWHFTTKNSVRCSHQWSSIFKQWNMRHGDCIWKDYDAASREIRCNLGA